MRRSLLERIVEERTAQTSVASVSVGVERIAEEFAREVLADEEFRRSMREMVREESRKLFESLRRKDEPPPRGSRSRTRAVEQRKRTRTETSRIKPKRG